MRTVSITEAKNGLSALLDQVRAGETIVITDRGVPVARLEPAAGRGDDEEGRLARLERRGIIRRGRGGIPDLLMEPPPRPRRRVSLSRTVIEERREGR
jgi:prevent-host-death family protein